MFILIYQNRTNKIFLLLLFDNLNSIGVLYVDRIKTKIMIGKIYIFFKIIRESLIFSINSLVVNKLRTFLSLLGITIGIFAIISVFTVIDSLENAIRDSVSALGDNMVYVQKWPWTPPPGEDQYPWWRYLKRPVPKLAEAEEIMKRSSKVEACAFAIGTSKTIQNGNNVAENVNVFASTPEYEKVRSFDIESGRYFSMFEQQSGRACAVLGWEIAHKLFPDEDPIEKELKVMGRKVTIIGVFKKEGSDMLGVSNDLEVHVPLNYARNMVDIRNERLNPFILVKAKNKVTADELVDELRGIMRSIRKLKPQQEDDFALNQSSMLTAAIQGIFTVIDLAGIIIGGFSILVGGFGIANIMFVSVKEQTQIIGIQKSLGAKSYFILQQFLYESIMLCFLGGALGLFFIWLGTKIVSYSSDMTFELSTSNIITGITISVVIGIISGIVPAYRASKMNPVEAMNTV